MNALLLSLALLSPAADPTGGVLPAGADGQPLNLDFEAGTLKDWTADGDAFRGQPVRGDTVSARRRDMKSRHQGQFWVGSYEKGGDRGQGTLTSVPFKVTHPWASFLVGGGAHEETCVELVNHPRNTVFFRASGLDDEDMKRVAVDLTKHVGRDIYVRLVDRKTGGWGHVNFDDFRFHTGPPAVPPRPEKVKLPGPDQLKYDGLPPDKAAAAMTVPEGFEVRLFAGEPDVHQPVGFCLDDRGRLWVAEAYAYPKRLPFPGPLMPPAERKKGDRIVVFEDTDGDGKHDKRTTFLEGLNLVSGIEVGFGGVWVGAAPYLLFVPDKDGDDKPDSDPQILLDGWGYQDTHETLNAFIWGPDGWLYGCHGVFTHSKVGKPGTADKDRTPINAGVWRYHPTRHQFEVFAHGTSNPWGLDYNEHGDFFVSSCVIPHCFHIFQGGRYQRQAGQHFNPYTYADIQTIADHRHYAGPNPHGGNNRSDAMGGGHAHCGLMCYQGGAWPKEYHGKLFMGNIHGRRLNVDILKPKGSGYVASHGKDFLLANDGWARFINLKYGPDGNVYLIDWYDKQACHKIDPEIWDRTNGRIYSIRYKGAKAVTGVNLRTCSDEELVKYQLHDNDWYARTARRILQERHGGLTPRQVEPFFRVRAALGKIAVEHPDETRRLRAVWALESLGGMSHGFLPEVAQALRRDASEQVRAWFVRQAADNGVYDEAVQPYQWLREMAATDPSPVVRRAVASALMRVYREGRSVILQGLLARPEDADDVNLPYLYWYALEPLAAADPDRALQTAAAAKIPSLLPFAARRVGAVGTPEAFALLTRHLAKAADDTARLAYLRGLADGLKGWRGTGTPKEWPATFAALSRSANGEVRSLALSVAVAFRDEKAMGQLRAVAADRSADATARQNAVASLLAVRDQELAPVLHRMVADPALRATAVRGLAAFEDAKTPAVLLAEYPKLSAAEKRDAVGTLAARPAFAKALLDAVAAKKLPAADIPAETIRQLRNLGDKAIDSQIAAVWGTVRETAADRKKVIADWAKRLTAGYQDPPDLAHGRAVYAKVCQQCHTLYAVGGKVGPDITGANRADLGYLLENIFDPSAVIPKEYAATKLDLIDGRVVTGIVNEGRPGVLTVITATETLTVPAADVEKRTPSDLSMMPDDLTKQLPEADLRALVAYLRSPQQVPMRATAENAKEFFNGKDLSNWDGDKALWAVENGEVVGKTATGLKRNNFLRSQAEVADFKLSLKAKLTPNTENSGIQFRSEPIEGGEMRGPQADMGQGWWGKLYEESGRGLLWKESGEKHVKPGDWNEYVIEAKGSKVRTWINGQLCVDLNDPKLARKGVVAFQLHSGGPMEVRFKDVKLEVYEK